MALPGPASLRSDLEALPPEDTALAGMTAFANAISDYMDQVQGGPLGAPGIFIMNRALFATQLAALAPVDDTSWVNGVADAWETAVLASVITPGTISNPAWTASSVDINTLPSAATTIITIATAKTTLISGLQIATQNNDPPGPMAEAFHNATLGFTFNAIGLAIPGAPVPIPIPAQ